MFNVVNTFFAGFVSTEAIAALALSFPIFFIILSFGIGISQGTTALISNALGRKDSLGARILAMQSVSFAVLFSLGLTATGLLAAPFLFRMLGASGQYLDLSLGYTNIILLGVTFFMFQFIINSSLQAQGDAKSLRNVLIFGFFLNIILDPWFLFGGLGVPAMGIKGIALATISIEFLGCFYLAWKVLKTPLWHKLHWRYLIPHKDAFREISLHGFPASLNMMTVAIGVFVITFFVSKFGQEAVAAYGIASRIEQIALLPAIGLNMAILSIAGQNNGARLMHRVRETWRKSLKYGSILSIIGSLGIFLFRWQLMDIFTDDATVISIGAMYLPIAAFIFVAYIAFFQSVALLQGMKKPLHAVWIGFARQIALPLAVYPLFSLWFGLQGIWWGVFLVNWTTAIFTVALAEYILMKASAHQSS